MKTVAVAFLRYLVRRRGLAAVQLSGIAIGVAAAVGMALSARAALSSFSEAVGFLRGRATHSLERPAGPLDERLLRRLLLDPAVAAFSPAVDRRLTLGTGEAVRLLGVDPLLDRALRPQLSPRDPASSRSLDFLLDPRAALLSQGLANRLGLRVGGVLPTTRGDLRVVGMFPNPTGEPLVLMDIGHAQELYGLRGRVDRVDLILSDPAGFLLRWGQGYRILSSGQSQSTYADLLRAFRLNLEALSLLGLFVGVFLVYNTAMFAVVSRRRDAGILRSLGARRWEIAAAFLLEILLLGGLGGAAGGALGFVLSRFLTALVGRTVSSLYFFLTPTPPPWDAATVAAGVVLGLGASLLGAAFPLAELVKSHAVDALAGRVAHRHSARRARITAAAGVAVLALSAAVLATVHHVYGGFAGAFGLLLGSSLLAGVALIALGPALSRAFRALGGLPGQLAAGNLVQNLGRSAVAVAAFLVALSMTLGLGLMIGSFRQTLTWWMQSQLTGELYVAASSDVEVPEAFYRELRTVPGVGAVDPYRNVQVLFRGHPIRVSAVNPSALQRYARFGWLRGGDENWEPVKRGQVLVSESFQRRFGLGPGDSIALQGAHGPATLRIAAVFYDYTTEHGLVMMARETYLRIFDDPTLDSVAVFVDPATPAARRDEILASVRRLAAARGLPVSSRAELHGNILAVFDATFAATRAMRLLAVVVAFFGITGALLTLYLERQRDFGIYRALGFSTGQVAAMTLMEGLGMGLVSFLLSAAVGTALSLVLIRAINLQSFHWTIFFHPHWVPYATAGATALLASVGAAAYPIWRVWRNYPTMQLREE
ncbi:MAG: FtsX-like permease family protein [Deltaproteobacteria bacterium]|nr:FtsX-like permease family protein [Deltaproteobacteria bacterium]